MKLTIRGIVLVACLWACAVAPAGAATLIDTNSTWRFLRGTNEASLPDITAWRGTNFNDAAFADSPAPFWYGDVYAGGTQLPDMANSFSCVFLRHAFVVSNVAEIGGLKLGAFIDDGFAAWINGREVRRVNLTNSAEVPVTFTNFASNATEPVPFAYYDLDPPGGYLVEGTNVLAVQGFNTSLTSSDFGFDCTLVSILRETNPPVIVGVVPVPGTLTNLTQITVTFSEPVTGVTADSLLVNRVAATGLSGGGAVYTFTFPQPVYGGISITWASGQSITDLATPPNPFAGGAPGATWEYVLQDTLAPWVITVVPAANAIVRQLSQVEVTFSENVSGVEAGDLLINGAPATNVTAQPVGRYLFQFAPPAAGSVSLAWADGHGITDLAVPGNAFGGGTWSCYLDPAAVLGELEITEILVGNQTGLEDEDIDPVTHRGEPQDWIEIRNRGSNAVDLAGWSLSDDPLRPTQWVFPSRVLGAGEYLVVFASGKDRRAPAGTNKFHTNFKLSRGGEFLGLYSPDAPPILVSGFSPQYPEQRNDHSYGFDSLGNLRYFAVPAPGGPNGTSTIEAVAAPVHFSVQRGFFTQPFDLNLTTTTPGGLIRYTTDGTEPSAARGTLYLGPLRITNSTLLRAAVFKNHFLPSVVGTHSYLFNQSAAIRSLPVISLVTDPVNLTGPTGIIGISNVVLQADGSYVPADPTGYHNPSRHGIAWERPVSAEYILPEDNSGFQIDCGIRVQGSDYQRPRTTASSKFSFRLYFRGDYGPGRLEYPLFPLTPLRNFDQIVLRAGFNDNSNPFIRDELTRRLSHDQGQVSSHGTLANLFVNGIYKGYYNPCERVHEEFAQAYHGGSEDWDVVSPSWAVGAGSPGVVDGDRSSFVSLVNYINQNSPLNSAIYREVSRRLDLTNFVDYLLLNVYAGMGDWPHNNFRAGRDRGLGGIYRFWVWDGEWGFGIYGRAVTRDTFAENGPGPDNSGLASTSGSEIAQIYQRLRLSPEFRLLLADRLHKHFFNGGALTDANITLRFNELRTNMLGVLPSMDASILTTWVAQRRAVVMTNFNTYSLIASSNAPTFSRFGGRVPRGFNLTLSNLAGAIYYTTNGSDPRIMFTGEVSPEAAVYTGPLVLNQSVQLRARSLEGASWSAMTEAEFQVAQLGIPLRVTEINFNPVGGPAYEFLELQNVGGTTLDLSRMFFDEGITYAFLEGTRLEPGATFVLVSNNDTNAFLARHPDVTIGGVYGGQLANGGERLTLRDRNGQVAFTVDYDDESGWPLAADGAGSSLEIVDPFGDPDDPANWRASVVADGTPGSVSAPPSLGAVFLNEVMATNLTAVANGDTHPDWVELHNSGATPVSLDGWSLSDDGNPRKFVFPENTTIDGGGFLVVWCDDATNATPGLHTGFALDRSAETLSLYNATTSIVDAVSFGLQVPDFSLGRVDGEWQLTLPTTNAANLAAPLASATNLVINEWLANAAPGFPDWLELYNRSATLPVSLRGCYLASTNGLHQLTSLAFLPPGGFLKIFADEAVGPDHLSFKLPAVGGSIVLYDSLAVEVNRVNYSAQIESVSQGRLPDGNTNAVSFPAASSPGAANYTNSYTGPYLNEVLARNRSAVTNAAGRTADYVELYNPGAAGVDLSGMSLSVDRQEPGQWYFPAGTAISGQSYLVVWCDNALPATTAPGAFLNTGRALNGESGGVYLFNVAGQVVNQVEYGFQVENLPLGRVGISWRLLNGPTPAATNAAPSALAQATALRLNEWMADVAGGDDWFEIYNTNSLPVDLSRLYLSDDLSSAGQIAHQVAPLSFIGGRQFVRWIADGTPDNGRNHVSFSLDADGDNLRLYATNFTVLDTVSFGRQFPNLSEGRFPDGQASIVSFHGSPSPGESNYRLLEGLAVNEVLPQNAAPLEAAIELHNTSTGPVSIGGWYLSDSQLDFRKYRIPDGTIVPAGGYWVTYENAFNVGTTNSFAWEAMRGGEVWLSEADGSGNLTGYRTGIKFGPVPAEVSVGMVATAVGKDATALAARTFGVDTPSIREDFRLGTGMANAGPKVGPLVINEVMYHPPLLPNGSGDDEFVELHNLSTNEVKLYDVLAPANRWRLAGAIDYIFPPGTALAPGAYLVVVNFDPAVDPVSVARFRGRYGVGLGVPLYGPFNGKLDNAGETLELQQPAVPQGPLGVVPYLPADEVAYDNTVPWPTGGVEGGGLSLQRRAPTLYGNEPTYWTGAMPTPGAANGGGTVPPPVITQSPAGRMAVADDVVRLVVGATGSDPLSYQWRLNGVSIAGATNTALEFAYAQPEDSGDYDVLVSNPGGSAVSAAARLTVYAMPELVTGPVTQFVKPNTNVTFSVLARGSAPMTYRWRLNGALLPLATGPTLTLTNVQLANEGEYEVTVSNPAGQFSARANLFILISPAVVQGPLSQTVVAGGDFSLSVVVSGNPAPFTYSWRRITPGMIWTNVIAHARSNFVTLNTTANGLVLSNALITNIQCRLVISNVAASGQGIQSPFTITVLADSDQDGLPDIWETAYEPAAGTGMDATADSDGDGLSNLAEYRVGTDPTNALSFLKLDYAVGGSQTVLQFGAVSNRTYSVQYAEEVAGIVWNKVADVVAYNTNRIEILVDPVVARNRFYRVVSPAQP